MDQIVKCDIVQHLRELEKAFFQHFPEEIINYDWVRNPFSSSIAPFTEKTIKEFIELSNNGNLKLQFTNQTSSKF